MEQFSDSIFKINLDLETYLEKHTSKELNVLADLNRQTHLKSLMPRMLSGNLQGKFLQMLSQMIRPKKILEIGTFTGYSAICLAQGLQKGGKLVTIEKNDEVETFAKEHFKKAGFADTIEMKIGDATSIIPQLDSDWDLVFIDADKPNYPLYFDLIVDKMTSGAWIIADNVLWGGKVTADPKTFDAYTKGIVEFNKKAVEDARVECMVLPFRDGLNIIRRL